MLFRISSFVKIHNTHPLKFGTKRFLTANIYIVGKSNAGEQWIADGIGEYEKRLRPVMQVKTTFLKSNDELIKSAEKTKGIVFALDENGKQYTSIGFSKLVFDSLIEGGSHINFIIGGAEGLPSELKNVYKNNLISLSKMTFTHTHARLVLYEQLYRASEIQKGSKYHKE